MQLRKGGNRKKRRVVRSGVPRPMGMGKMLFPPTQIRTLTANHIFTLNNAANGGANSTFSPYVIGTYNASIIVPGLEAMWNGSSSGQPGQYLSARLRKIVVNSTLVNKESFPVEVALLISQFSPANNSLSTVASQVPYLSRTGEVVKFRALSPTTGQDRTILRAVGTNRRVFGVANVRGLSDSFTNSWNSTTDAGVAATSGMSYIFLLRSSTNLVNGVFVACEAQLTFEFFQVNPDKPA